LTLIAAFSLMLVSMIGVVVAQEEEGDPQLSYKQPTLYMKAEGDGSHLWMDSLMPTNESEQSHTDGSETGSGTKSEDYAQDPALDHTLYLDPQAGDIIIHLHMERLDNGFHDSTVHFQLSAGPITVNEEVSSTGGDEANWHLEINLSEEQTEISSGTAISFHWDYDWQAGSAQYRMHTDGSSYITFPVELDTDNDGSPDRIDDDDDNDGYSDEKELRRRRRFR